MRVLTSRVNSVLLIAWTGRCSGLSLAWSTDVEACMGCPAGPLHVFESSTAACHKKTGISHFFPVWGGSSRKWKLEQLVEVASSKNRWECRESNMKCPPTENAVISLDRIQNQCGFRISENSKLRKINDRNFWGIDRGSNCSSPWPGV